MVAHPFENGAGHGGRAQCVRVTALARQRLTGLLGSGAQGIGVAQPCLVDRQLRVLPGPRVDGLDLAKPEPEQVGLPGAFASAGHHLVELTLGRAQPGVQRRVGLREGQDRLTAEPVERLALCSRPEQPVLVGLAVHGHQRFGHLGQPRHRDRRPTDPGPGPPLARHVAGQHHPAVLDLAAGVVDRGTEPVEPVASTTPSTRALPAPVRTMPLSARPPSSSPSAVTTIVLPAPVSPVITVSPGPSLSVEDSMTPSCPIRISSSISARLVPAQTLGGATPPLDRQVELGDQPVGERRLVQPGQADGLVRAAYLDPGARRQVDARRPSHHSTPAPSVRAITSTASSESGATTSGRANRACALIGTISSASTPGQTIGPPALKL